MCSYVRMYSYMWLCVAMCGYGCCEWLSVHVAMGAVSGCVWLWVAVCGYVWLWVTMGSYVHMCSYVWLCVAMCGYGCCEWLCVAMGDYG